MSSSLSFLRLLAVAYWQTVAQDALHWQPACETNAFLKTGRATATASSAAAVAG